MAYSLDVDLSFEQEIPVDLSFTQVSSRGGSSTPIYNADSSSSSGAYSAAYTNTLISNALVEAKAYTDANSAVDNDSITSYVTVSLDVTDGLISTTNGNKYNDGLHAYYDVAAGDELLVTGFSWSSNNLYPLCAFFDSSNNLVSVYGESSVKYTDEPVTVPDTAVKVLIHGTTTTGCGLKIKTIQDYETFTAAKVEELSADRDYEISVARKRITSVGKKDSFVWKQFDKAYYVFVLDGSNKYTGAIYDLFHSKGIPLSVACIKESLAMKYTDTRSIRELNNLIVADGGEVLAHYSANLCDEDYTDKVDGKTYLSDEESWLTYTRDVKRALEEEGWDIRGIIRADYTQYYSNTGEEMCQRYFDYSDSMGTSPQYRIDRKFFMNNTIDQLKAFVDKTCDTPGIYPFCLHGSEDSASIENLTSLLEYITNKGDGVAFSTYAKVFDTFGSTHSVELEESIIEKVSDNIFRGVGTFVSDEGENALTGVTITNTDGVISFSGTLVRTIDYRPVGLPFALTSGVTYTAKVTVETPVALPGSSAFNLYLDGGTAGWLANLNRTGQVSFTPKKDTVNAQIKLMATTDAAEAMDGAKITVVIVEGIGVPDDYDSDCFSTELLSKSPVIKTIQGATNGILMTSDEKPLSRLHMPHTFARAFNKIICIGDSLTAGGYEYTSGPSIPAAFSSFAYPEYLSRILGTTVENYGVSGATAVDSTQAQTDHHSWNMLATNNSWLTDSDKGDCYIIYLGTNDIGYYTGFDGVVDTDIDEVDYNNNAPTSVGGYAKIIQRIKGIQPKAAIFCVGLGNDRNTETTISVANEKIRAIAEKFGAEFLDFQYFGVPSVLMTDFKATYYNGGHYNTLGYAYRAEEIACYMDYAIRNNVDSFKQIAFIGTEYEYQAQ